ncbi:ribosome maturation factor RimP [Thalassospira marina]|uniref:Ribosome maturation factor RimP n=1 Tax=Thalassospira marina TaxID=2048283 RepID=A0A2N3KWA7_9PROT|nr:ribosome maturation factor RimP [Thalassospira marina]AUG55254.1 ribosome maturation factor RimP [Thalassospira marina]PKR54844.1 ribosome maturation factor RimP [Thalassospira marina]
MAELIGQQVKDPLLSRIADIIAPSIEAQGFELVRVSMMGKDSQILQIMADRPEGQGSINVEDCAEISRTVSALLDVDDPISGAYNLEVSSPGIDRPLTRRKDFDVWRGFDAKVELVVAVAGRRRFSGKLDGLEDDAVAMIVDGERELLPLADIAKAKLVLTDELIAHVTGPRRSDDNAE